MVREAVKEDLYELLSLYLFLHEDNIPEHSRHLENTWKTIIEDVNHHIIVNEINGKIISSCVLCNHSKPDEKYPSICIY